MNNRFKIAFLFFFCIQTLYAQLGLERMDTVPVLNEIGDTLRYPWAGGVNSPQFFAIDLNGDSIKDLFVMERADVINCKVLTFINNGTANEVDYDYAPEYESAFPEMNKWAVLVDYNCDGREDIFTWISGGMVAYRNDYNSTDGLNFTLVSVSSHLWSPMVTTDATLGPVNLFMSPFDMPVISDIDNDGDVDVLSFCLNCTTVEYNKNYSMENYGVCDSLDFVIENSCWGSFSESPLTNAITLGISCKGGENGNIDPMLHPGGSSMLALDMDGDHDKELVIGNISSAELRLLMNGGDSSFAEITSVVNDFPVNSIKVNIPLFPAAYHLDVNNDDIRDLLVAPNTTTGARNFTSVWYYNNQNIDDVPIFEYQQNNFLQENMIEVGEDAYPVFFDHDADGLMDLLVGCYGYWASGGNYNSQVALFLNVGTVDNPIFKLETRDYHNLSSYGLVGVHPCFGDLDGDGDKDMILGDYDGLLHYFENTAGTNNIASFTLVEANYKDIDVGQFSAPQIVDVNRDGYPDIIVGDREGKINYYQNKASGPIADFSSVATNDFFGGIDVDPVCCTGRNMPFLTELGNPGEYFLFLGADNGRVQVFGNIDGNLLGNFSLVDSMLSGKYFGESTSVSGGDINNDGILDLLVGNSRGGVSLMSITGTAVVSNPDIREKFDVNIYPNPSNGELWLECKSGYSFSNIVVYDNMGKLVLRKRPFNKMTNLNLNTLSPNIYLLKAVLSNGGIVTKTIMLY